MVGPSGLLRYRILNSQPDGLGYLNCWPLGPEELVIVTRFQRAPSGSRRLLNQSVSSTTLNVLNVEDCFLAPLKFVPTDFRRWSYERLTRVMVHASVAPFWPICQLFLT